MKSPNKIKALSVVLFFLLLGAISLSYKIEQNRNGSPQQRTISSYEHAEPAALSDITINSFEIPGAHENLEAIVMGGSLATANSRVARFTVMLQMFDRSNKPLGRCTGSIVGPDLVLSAGHCLGHGVAYVKVKFGLGGDADFQHEMQSRNFRWVNSRADDDDPSPWVNGYLTYDRSYYRDIRDYFQRNPDIFENYHYVEGIDPENFNDLALIKLPRPIPSGYRQIRFFMGSINSQNIYAAGYGVNSREKHEVIAALRFARQKVVGHYTEPGEDTVGLVYFSENNQSTCFGDSGGPLLVEGANNEFFLLGVIVSGTNNCAGESFAVLPAHQPSKGRILRWASELSSTLEL
jgi:hypothetical protein